MESSTVSSQSILLDNLMENSGSGENIKTVAKLVEFSIRLSSKMLWELMVEDSTSFLM